jgi:hypothetical protein
MYPQGLRKLKDIDESYLGDNPWQEVLWTFCWEAATGEGYDLDLLPSRMLGLAHQRQDQHQARVSFIVDSVVSGRTWEPGKDYPATYLNDNPGYVGLSEDDLVAAILNVYIDIMPLVFEKAETRLSYGTIIRIDHLLENRLEDFENTPETVAAMISVISARAHTSEERQQVYHPTIQLLREHGVIKGTRMINALPRSVRLKPELITSLHDALGRDPKRKVTLTGKGDTVEQEPPGR